MQHRSTLEEAEDFSSLTPRVRYRAIQFCSTGPRSCKLVSKIRVGRRFRKLRNFNDLAPSAFREVASDATPFPLRSSRCAPSLSNLDKVLLVTDAMRSSTFGYYALIDHRLAIDDMTARARPVESMQRMTLRIGYGFCGTEIHKMGIRILERKTQR